MPITLSDIKRDVRTTEVEYDGEVMEFSYKPSGYTEVVEDQFVGNMRGSYPVKAYVKLLANMLISFDLLDENGNALEPTNELLSVLPSRFLEAMFNAIMADMRAAREDRKNSGGGSVQKGSSGNARHGTR